MSIFFFMQVFQYLIILPFIGFVFLDYLVASLKLVGLAVYRFYSICVALGSFLYLAVLQLSLYLCSLFFSSGLFNTSLLLTNSFFLVITFVFITKAFKHKSYTLKKVLQELRKRFQIKIILLSFILFAFVGFFPVYENDTLEYFGVANKIKNFGLVNYPPISTTTAESLYAPSSHPPYFHLFISSTWEPESGLLLFKFIYVLFLIAFLRLLSTNGNFYMSAVFFFSVPICVFGFIGFHIDLFRMTYFILGFLIIMEAAQKKSYGHRSNAVFATASGLIVSPHSLGLVMLFLTLSTLILVNRKLLFNQLLPSLVGVILFAPQYILNTLNFGLPFMDGSVIQSIPRLEFDADLEQRRGLVGSLEKVINGAFRGIFDYTLFGLVIFVSTLIAINGIATKMRSLDFVTKVLYFMQLSFIAIELVSALLGLNMLIKNVRYYESIIPISILILNQRFLARSRKIET